MLSSVPIVEGVRFASVAEAPSYAVGDDGSVWTPFGRGQTVATAWKRLSIYRRPYGGRYCVVCLRLPSNREKVVCRYVHRLVLEAFAGPCPDGLECLHDDGDTSNNRATNLRWGNRVENTADKIRHGRFPVGSNHKNSKLTEDAVADARRLHAAGHSFAWLGRRYDVTPGVIARAVRRKGWTHVA